MINPGNYILVGDNRYINENGQIVDFQYRYDEDNKLFVIELFLIQGVDYRLEQNINPNKIGTLCIFIIQTIKNESSLGYLGLNVEKDIFSIKHFDDNNPFFPNQVSFSSERTSNSNEPLL